ncbi:MAG: hypothetical protein KC912_00690 [Proteobacteria bacterium]|nr:hypothetical protein [Pseudomonadota bacterium]
MILLFAIAALAQEPVLWVAQPSEAPSTDEAIEAASAWVAWATDAPKAEEVHEYLALYQVPLGPSDAYARDFVASLAPDGALGRLIEGGGEPRLALAGPDYTRVLFGGDPALSLIVRAVAGEVRVDRVERTHCTFCSEPARAAHDLLARSSDGAPVLWPNVDLSVAAARQAHHLGAQRVAALEKRAERGELHAVFQGAEVVSVDGAEVSVRLGETIDTWTMVYERGAWLVDYESLDKGSPLRLGRRQAEDFRPRWSRTPQLLELYRTQAKRIPGGIELADRVIGAAFDPKDGSVVTAVFDVDRATAGLLRLDPETGEVLDRWPIPPAPRIPIDIEHWFDSWHMALSPDGSKVALSAPGKIETLDLISAKRELVYAYDQASDLSWVHTEDGDVLVIGQRSAVHMLHDGRHSTVGVGAPTVGVGSSGGGLVIVTGDGVLHRYDLKTRDHETEEVCCGGAQGAAPSTSRGEIVVTCPQVCDVAADRRALVGAGSTLLDGAGTDGRGAAWSEDGLWLATAAMGESEGLLLWNSNGEPLAQAGAGEVRVLQFDPAGEQLLAVTTEGRLHIFNVESLRLRGLADDGSGR